MTRRPKKFFVEGRPKYTHNVGTKTRKHRLGFEFVYAKKETRCAQISFW